MQTQVTPMSCNALNIPMMHKQIVSLSKMQAALRHQLNGLARERDIAKFMNGGLLAARIVKASCDTILGVIGEMAGTLPAPVAAKVKIITTGYSHATDWAEIGTKAAIGQNVRSDIQNYATKHATSFTTKKVGGKFGQIAGTSKDFGESFTKLQVDKSKIVIHAMNQEEDKLLDDIVGYGETFSQMATAAAGNQKVGSLIGAGFALFNGGKEIVAAYKDFDAEDPDGNYEAQKKTLTRLINRTSQQIDKLKTTIMACQPDYQQTQYFA